MSPKEANIWWFSEYFNVYMFEKIFVPGKAITRDGHRLNCYESGSGSAYQFRFLTVPISVPK